LSILALIMFLFSCRRNRGKVRAIAIRLIVVAGVLTSTLISLIPGALLLNRDVRNAHAYCEVLVPELDRIKAQTGNYPLDLPMGHAKEPHLLARSPYPYYWSDGSTFRFSFPDPKVFFNMYDYNSTERKWNKWD
ncbi:MAG: hypothetical protein NTV06_00630, partial [candidate division Zixibacteria bacterium]|nr:hypothetical protein [candidate division Zixibacteria bacterium]